MDDVSMNKLMTLDQFFFVLRAQWKHCVKSSSHHQENNNISTITKVVFRLANFCIGNTRFTFCIQNVNDTSLDFIQISTVQISCHLIWLMQCLHKNGQNILKFWESKVFEI